MKVMIINSLYSPYKFGGAEVSVRLLAESLTNKGVSVRVITLNDEGRVIRKNLNSVEVISIPLKNIYWPFSSDSHGALKKIVWHLKDAYNSSMMEFISDEIDDFKPDVIHTNNLAGFSIGVWSVVKRKGYPLIHTIRDYYLFHPNSTLFKNGKNVDPRNFSVKLFSFFKKKESQKIDMVVGISDFISTLHESNGFSKKAKFYHVYNPVDKIKKVYSGEKGRLSIGFIGRLTSEKGFDVFLDYAEEYRESANFIAAGTIAPSSESNELLKRAQSLGVDVQGYVPVDKFLTSVDALLLPTKWNEPFGRVVAEAALSKTPVFTNLTGGVKEISELFSWVSPLEQFGLEKVNEVLDMLSSYEGDQNPFDKEKHAENYLKLYNELILSYRKNKI